MAPLWSLTEHLLTSAPDAFEAATQAPFLRAAAEGSLSKEDLGKWLANDRLYIHAYIRAVGQTLVQLDLPQHVPKVEAPETQFVDWLIDTLYALRREERLFLDVATRYGLTVDLLPHPGPGATDKAAEQGIAHEPTKRTVPDEAKVPGLPLIEKVFTSIHTRDTSNVQGFSNVTHTKGPALILPWLEAAVTFWGTERCYLDAWSWSKAQQSAVTGKSSEDADGGALRAEFIPNWSSAEFSQVVDRLGKLIDFAVSDSIAVHGGKVKDQFIERTERGWKQLLAAEAAFWPVIE